MEPIDVVADEVKRAINRQEANLDSLRTRALGLLTASGIAAALFSPRTLARHLNPGETTALIIALLAFGAGAVLSLLIQRPAKFQFSLDLNPWFTYNEPPTERTASQLTYDFSKRLWESHQNNTCNINIKTAQLTATCGAVLVQVLAWSLSLL